jgi:hypothetical protein
MWICGMGMWMLHNGYVGETQEDLSIVPSSKGDQKRQKRAHEKPTITYLVGSGLFWGQLKKLSKSICPHWMPRQKLKIGSRNGNEKTMANI